MNMTTTAANSPPGSKDVFVDGGEIADSGGISVLVGAFAGELVAIGAANALGANSTSTQ